MLNKNPYTPTEWYDDIVDDTLPIEHPSHIIEEGTPFMAAYANNIENGIYNAHEQIILLQSENLRMRVQLEIDGRVPGNQGSYYDTFVDEPTRMLRQTASADITQAVAIGATVLQVDNVLDFKTLTEVTIYDGTNAENTLITAIGTNTITVRALTKSYVKGSKIARSNSLITDGQMKIGSWGNYSVAVVEVV